MNKLSEENRALFNRVLGGDGRWWDGPLTEDAVNRLLNAARSEGLSSPGVGGGKGEEEEAQGCGTDGAELPPCQPESPASAAEAASPVCRVCGKPDDVGCYWPDRPELTICVTCCETAEHADGETGHVWEYERAEQDRVCQHCGQFARNTDFYLHWDQP